MRNAIGHGSATGGVLGAIVVALVLAGLLVPGTPAFAEPGDVDASECLSGDAGPRDLVAESSFGWFRTISLYCGDITKGIIHIVQSHPIDEDGADDDDIVTCLDAVLANGEETRAGFENRAYEAKRSDGGTATVAWDEATDEVVTMFTNDPGGNNWAACAELVDA